MSAYKELFKEFKGKRVIITGGSRGLGREIVKSFYEHGAIVCTLGRNRENLEQLKIDFPNVHTIQCDLSNWEETRKEIEKIEEPFHILVNNAAINIASSFLDIDPNNFDSIMGVNVKCVINLSQIVAKKMIANKIKGSIVNISSVGSKVYSKNITLYCTSKAALDMLTKCMAVELGENGIRVNSVNPTLFASDMSKNLLEKLPNGGEDFLKRVPLKRIAETQEIVNTVLFLASDLAPMITGEQIRIDGGALCS